MGLTDLIASLFDMDFRGQRLAESLYQGIIIAFSLAGFIAGYSQQSLRLAVQIWAAGFALACLATLIGWPCFRRHPVKWLESLDAPIPEQDTAPSAASDTTPASAEAAPASSGLKQRKGGH